MPRRYYTDIFVTVNSNRAGQSGEDEARLIQDWLEFLEGEVWTEAGMEQLLVYSTTQPGETVSVDINEPVIEAGPNKRRVHAHWTMSILHTGHISLSRMLTRWYNFFNARTIPMLSNGVNIQFRLLDTAARNYNMKETELGGVDEINF